MNLTTTLCQTQAPISPPFFIVLFVKWEKFCRLHLTEGRCWIHSTLEAYLKIKIRKKCFDVLIESFYWKLGKGPSINDVRPFFRFYYPLPSNQWFFWTYLKFFFHLKQAWSKGQYTSKCCFGVFNFSQKTNENMSTWGIIVVKSNLIERNEK